MGIINELRQDCEYYEGLGLRKHELNEKLSDEILEYINCVCLESEKKEIREEYGSLNVCAGVLAEEFIRNGYNFEDGLLEENNNIGEGRARAVRGLFRSGARRKPRVRRPKGKKRGPKNKTGHNTPVTTGAGAGSKIKPVLRKAGKGLWVVTKGAAKVVKHVGLFVIKHWKLAVGAFVIYDGWKWINGEDSILRRVCKAVWNWGKEKIEGAAAALGLGGGGGSLLSIGNDVYSKEYGQAYANADPEDYRIA